MERVLCPRTMDTGAVTPCGRGGLAEPDAGDRKSKTPVYVLTRRVPDLGWLIVAQGPRPPVVVLSGRVPACPYVDNLRCRRSVAEGPVAVNLNGIPLTLMEMVNGVNPNKYG